MIRRIELEKEKQLALLSNYNRDIEEFRQKRNNEQNNFDEIQKEFYKIGSDIASCEKDIEHTLETEVSRKEALGELLDSIKNLNLRSRTKSRNIMTCWHKSRNSSLNKTLTDELIKLDKDKKDANFAMQNLQSQTNTFVIEQSDTIKEKEVENAKLDASEKSLNLLSKRLGILEAYSMNENTRNDSKDELLRKSIRCPRETLSVVSRLRPSQWFSR